MKRFGEIKDNYNMTSQRTFLFFVNLTLTKNVRYTTVHENKLKGMLNEQKRKRTVRLKISAYVLFFVNLTLTKKCTVHHRTRKQIERYVKQTEKKTYGSIEDKVR